MRGLPQAKPARPLLAGALAVAVVVVASACGTGGRVSGGDIAHGKQVFSQNCASCHTLQAAGAVGTIGPNLDNAFSADREQNFKESSIQEIVADQIRVPLQGISTPNGSLSPNGATVMPANIVKGKDLVDVSAFVARCAGNANDPACLSSRKVTATAGKDVFEQAGCGSCHTLRAAGTTGTVGPNLDQLKPPLARIVRQVTNGGAIMPAFKSKLTSKQIQAVAQYVFSVAGK